MTINDIELQINLIDRAISWGRKYERQTFPIDLYKSYRRHLKKIHFALQEKCAVAAYGESQVGKSYLIGSLLSTSANALSITDGTESFNFVDEINPSGGRNQKAESTGVITRFSVAMDNPKMSKFVKIRTLSIPDIVMILSDSFYKDVDRDQESIMTTEIINREIEALKGLLRDNAQTIVGEDDIADIQEYFLDVIKGSATHVNNSRIFQFLGENINKVGIDHFSDFFALLWDGNEHVKRLFNKLVHEFGLLKYQPVIFIPIDAVLAKNGTLLKITWLDAIFNEKDISENDIPATDVYAADGTILCKDFPKSYLSALTAELNFNIPSSMVLDRPFLKDLDLLDFPGARRREAIDVRNVPRQLPEMLRRGKVAYLFNKYSRSKRLNTILFCKDQDMNGDSTIGASLSQWIDAEIGKTPQERKEYIDHTGGVSPIFIVATKANMELKWTKEMPDAREALAERWKTRFDINLVNEVIKPKSNPWFEDWIDGKPFQAIYPIRDFFWSRDQHIFSGYKENVSPETEEIVPPDYPDYRKDLKESFIHYPFVMRHFESPKNTWESFATLNNDGTLPIIRDLNRIAPHIGNARSKRYLEEFKSINMAVIDELLTHFVADNVAERIENAKLVSGDVKLFLEAAFGMNPAVFGRIINTFMISAQDIRPIVYDILCRHTERPKDASQVNVIRMQAGINPEDDRQTNLRKMMDRYNKTETQLTELFSNIGVTLDDVISGDSELLASETDLVTQRVIDLWDDHLNQAADSLNDVLMRSRNIVTMYRAAFRRLHVKDVLHKRIDRYIAHLSGEVASTAIADSSSLILNNFISTVGREYMTKEDVEHTEQTAAKCGIVINTDEPVSRSERPLKDVLHAFEISSKLLSQRNIDEESRRLLRELPLWDNFIKWENRIVSGLIFTSEIADCDPVANEMMRNLIRSCKELTPKN